MEKSYFNKIIKKTHCELVKHYIFERLLSKPTTPSQYCVTRCSQYSCTQTLRLLYTVCLVFGTVRYGFERSLIHIIHKSLSMHLFERMVFLTLTFLFNHFLNQKKTYIYLTKSHSAENTVSIFSNNLYKHQNIVI